VHGLAHITGGGLVDNVPRIMPAGLCAEIDRATWHVPLVFQFMQEKGRVDRDEMFRVFNMGIGMVVIVRSADTEKSMHVLKKARSAPCIIGRVIKGKKPVKFLN